MRGLYLAKGLERTSNETIWRVLVTTVTTESKNELLSNMSLSTNKHPVLQENALIFNLHHSGMM